MVPIHGTLGAALVGALTLRYIVRPYEARTKKDIARVESDLAQERDERKALRDRFNSQEAKRFDVLHEKRATVIAETYSALFELVDAHTDFSNSSSGFVGGPSPMDRWKVFAAAADRFRRTFGPNRILFDKELADDLASLSRAYADIANQFSNYLYIKVKAKDIYEDDAETLPKAEYSALRTLLESERFREAFDLLDPLQQKIEYTFRKF